ncbi:MAG: PAS domain S-box protein [Syntrophorhabdaceae bacterium]|nr:PAS domain S-box protein [Syntrophorhabdaceae bacterium]
MTSQLNWEDIILGFKRTTRDFLETVVENLSESFIVTDLEGRIGSYNKGSEALFQYTPREILGKSILSLGVKKPNVLARIRRGETFRGEVVCCRKSGESFPAYVVCIPLRDQNGRPMAMVGSARDLTAEKEIERLKQFNESIVTSLNDGIQIVDRDGYITFTNKRFEELTGHGRGEIIGRHYQSFVARDALEKFREEIKTEDQNHGRKVFETMFITKDNKKIPVMISASRLYRNGVYDGMINAFIDVTEVKILKEELFQSEKLTLLGKLAGEIAHEINNPLSGLIMATQMLMEDVEAGQVDPADILNELKGIENDARRCRNFIEKVLGFSRMLPEKRDVFNVNDTIEDSLILVARQAELDNIRIEKDFWRSDLLIFGSSNNLQQVIINAVNNARDAMAPLGGIITIKTYPSVKNRKKLAIIEINDTGRGIPRDVIGRIFDSFFTTKEKGTGLGLSVSKRIVEEHGGTLFVGNRESGGASLVITLPRK